MFFGDPPDDDELLEMVEQELLADNDAKSDAHAALDGLALRLRADGWTDEHRAVGTPWWKPSFSRSTSIRRHGQRRSASTERPG